MSSLPSEYVWRKSRRGPFQVGWRIGPGYPTVDRVGTRSTLGGAMRLWDPKVRANLTGRRSVTQLLVNARDCILADGLGELLAVEVGPVEAVRVDYGLGGGAGCVVALAPGRVGEDGVGEGDALEGGRGLFFLLFGDLVCGNGRNISTK